MELLALTNYGGADGIALDELEVIAGEQVLAPPPHAHHLAGKWRDGNNPVVISQHGDSIVAHYVNPYVCDFRDGTGRMASTTLDFDGVIDFDTISGKTSVCSYGRGNPLGVGLKLTTITLTISTDDRTLRGTWYNANTKSKESVTITRTGS